jgi:hypothetical protein
VSPEAGRVYGRITLLKPEKMLLGTESPNIRKGTVPETCCIPQRCGKCILFLRKTALSPNPFVTGCDW